ncbi:MAG: hypothetical protein JNJ70_06925 [Verrucomicrobiales bacterium]|nr:hypothetical protein [Verrucomicrobiales bacterium]
MELLPVNASPLKIYSQAKRILKSTSRAKEPDWYKPAHELNLQWHLWIGAHSGVSAIYSRSLRQWWTGPDLPSVSLEVDEHGIQQGLDKGSRDAVHELIRKILAAKEFGAKAKSLGVVIHLGDGIRIRDLSPDFAGDDDFDGLNELLISAPDVALGDDSIDTSEGKWRILPLAGIQEGPKRSLAVQVSSKLKIVADEIENYGEMRNIPVVVNTRSAQLESLSGLAYAFPEILSVGAGSTLALIQYETMTLLFAIGNRGELQLVRPLMHRGTPHLSPTETHEVLSQTAALLNIKDATIVLASVSGLTEERLQALLEPYREQFPNARVNCFDLRNSPLTEGIPGSRFEFAVSVIEGSPRTDEAPFQKQLRDRWTRQDFYGPSKEEQARIPQRADLQLLKFSGIAQKIAFVAILAFCGWTGMDFVTKMRSEAWKLSPDDAQRMETQLASLQKERREWQHWDRLLEKRSEGWLALEALLELFPADGGVILRDANFRVETEDTARTQEVEALGLKRQWDIAGFANPELAASLPTLGSRTRVAELLNGIAERNHAPYLAVNTDTRDLQVTLQQKQGTMPPTREFPAKVARHFRTAFELNITQSLSSKDDLAINISKASE